METGLAGVALMALPSCREEADGGIEGDGGIDGDREEYDADQDAPAAWNLLETIGIPAGSSVSIRQYAVDAHGWDIHVANLPAGVLWNRETERIVAEWDAASASSTATFTLSRGGFDDVVDTATVTVTTVVAEGLVLSTKFSGLSFIKTYPASDLEYGGQPGDYALQTRHRLEGTDIVTGFEFTETQPRLWGSEHTNEGHRVQVLASGKHDPIVAPLEHFTRELRTDVGGVDGSNTVLRVRRNGPWLAPDQHAYQILPDTAAKQGMLYIRCKLRFDPNWAGGNMSLLEVKTAAMTLKYEIALTYANRLWRLRCGSQGWDANSHRDVWPDAHFRNHSGAYYFFPGAVVPNEDPTAFGRWWTIEWACRFENEQGDVQGGGFYGWAWAATSQGTKDAAAMNATGTQRFYKQGPNLPADSSANAGIVFPMLYYPLGAGGYYIDYGSTEVWTRWPDDASEHPVEAV